MAGREARGRKVGGWDWGDRVRGGGGGAGGGGTRSAARVGGWIESVRGLRLLPVK